MELIHYYEDLNTLHVGTEKPRCYYIPKKTDGTDSYRFVERAILASSFIIQSAERG